MARKPGGASDPAQLRRTAEARLAGRDGPGEPPNLDEGQARRLVHELQVHQIELELQNEELQRARDEIAALLDGYADLYDFAPVGYLTLDPKGFIRQANLTAATLLGVERSRLLGSAFSSVLAPEGHLPFLEFLGARLAGGDGTAFCDLPCRRHPGRAAWVRVESTGVPATRECRVALMDISERKRAEEDRRRFEADLIHAQKLESLGCLAAGVAHDINNVLGAIYAVVETQKRKPKADPDLLSALDLILQATRRGRNLVGGLTAFSRTELLEPEPVDLNALVVQEVDLLQRSTLQLVAFDLDLAQPPPRVLGEYSRLAAALMNLCVNAVDAMPQGGRILLRTTRIAGAEVELTVEDDGPGMPREVLERAADPFFTTKPLGRGTGLGLSTSFATAKAHGGTLKIDSEPGRGTRVTLRLPEHLGAMEARTEAPAPTDSGTALTILLVDDDDLIRATVPALLGSLGHRVESVASGREALGRIAGSPRIDLVILDQNMPGMTGLETLPLIRATHPRLPVLFATGNLENFQGSAQIRDPWVKIIGKPFGFEDLERALADYRTSEGAG